MKHVIFDFGNVLVQWKPFDILRAVFPDEEPADFYEKMRPLWLDINLGKLSEQEALPLYAKLLKQPIEKFKTLFEQFKTSQHAVPGSMALLESLHAHKIPLYGLTDNTREIVAYHQKHSHFLHYFKDIACSAELGVLKPNPAIYRYLLDRHHLTPASCLFTDDILPNVEGAQALGIHAFQFINAEDCRKRIEDWLGFSLSKK